jgi:hypothetical protein
MLTPRKRRKLLRKNAQGLLFALAVGFLLLGCCLWSGTVVGSLAFLLSKHASLSFLFHVLLRVCLALVVTFMGFWLWSKARSFAKTKPRPSFGSHCAKCGYPLQGLKNPRCPECGTAFLERLDPSLCNPTPGKPRSRRPL